MSVLLFLVIAADAGTRIGTGNRSGSNSNNLISWNEHERPVS